MRQSKKCIKCGCHQLWIADKFSDSAQGDVDNEVSVVATGSRYDKNPRALFNVQAIVCANVECGYTEFYTYKFDRLVELHKRGEGIRLMNSDPGSAGPYR